MYADQLLNSHACEFLWVDSDYTLCTKSMVQCLKVMCKVFHTIYKKWKQMFDPHFAYKDADGS